MTWGTVTRRRFDSKRFALNRLHRNTVGKRKHNDTTIDIVDHMQFETLLHCRDAYAGLHRYVGYVPTTRRVIEIAWRDDGNHQATFSRSVREMFDQPSDSPQHWAFFSVSFVAPAGFVYHGSTLNLGDMRVSLIRAGRDPGELTMRQIYPAKLALTRGDLMYWLSAQLDAASSTHRQPTPKQDAQQIDTIIGPGLACDAVRRIGQRLISPRHPRASRFWIIHDLHHDRLMAVRLADDPKQFNKRFTELVASLHWADPPK